MWKFQLYVLSLHHKVSVWRTDRENYDPQDHASIAASRGKNAMNAIASGQNSTSEK